VPVGDHLIARLQHHHVTDEYLIDRHRPDSTAAEHAAVRCDEQREAVQRPLRAHLLGDPDRRVGDDHAKKQGILPIAEDQRQRAETGKDHVEHRQHVRPNDARV
jgi:hypothetical protein